MHTLARTLGTLCVFAAAALPQTAPHLPPSIRTSGQGTVTAKPDRVIIDLGVVTQDPTAQAAASGNAARITAVSRELKTVAGASAEIKTVNYSLDPDYRYPKPGGQPVLAGYTARNTIQVTTADLDAAGAIIDTATKAGANSIDRLQFTLKDDQAPRAEALRAATANAKAGAEAMAAALGVKLSRLLSAEENTAVQTPVRPFYALSRAGAEGVPPPPTPIVSGTLDVHATVTLTFEITQ